MNIFSKIFNKIFHKDESPSNTTSSQANITPSSVDIEQVMSAYEKQSNQKLNWRTSIVDLLKLLNLDSSLEARRSLADELHYTGDKNDTAAMNVWLIKEVMNKLAENGGKVPEELKHAS